MKEKFICSRQREDKNPITIIQMFRKYVRNKMPQFVDLISFKLIHLSNIIKMCVCKLRVERLTQIAVLSVEILRFDLFVCFLSLSLSLTLLSLVNPIYCTQGKQSLSSMCIQSM